MKKIILILFVPLFISGCLGLVFNTADARLYNTRFSKSYSHRKFKKIEAGFTRDRVIEIIGEPISKYTTDYYYGVLYSNDKRSSIRPYSGGVSVPLDSGTEKEHRFLYFQCNSSGKIIWFSHNGYEEYVKDVIGKHRREMENQLCEPLQRIEVFPYEVYNYSVCKDGANMGMQPYIEIRRIAFNSENIVVKVISCNGSETDKSAGLY